MSECKKDCFNCSNSFVDDSEEYGDNDVLVCILTDQVIEDDNAVCNEWN